MQEDFDIWGAKIDISASQMNKKASESKMLKQLKSDLPTLSQKAWDELFDMVKAEYNRRK